MAFTRYKVILEWDFGLTANAIPFLVASFAGLLDLVHSGILPR